MAELIVFPHARRVGYIRSQARSAAKSHWGADKYIEHVLDKRRGALLRLGIPADVVESEMRTAERAIRCHITRITMEPTGAA